MEKIIEHFEKLLDNGEFSDPRLSGWFRAQCCN